MEQHKSAEAAAQSVIEHTQAEARARTNARAPAVAPLYRFAALKSLDRSQQQAIVKQAIALANHEPAVIALCGAWLATLVALAFASPAWFHGLAVSATVLLFVLPFLFYQRSRVKHHVQQLLRANTSGQRA